MESLKVLAYMRDYKREAVLAPLFKLLESLMDLLVPLIVAAIINQGIGGSDMGVVMRYFALLIGLAVLGMAFSFTAQWMAAKASVGCATQLRQALFDRVQALSFAELDSVGTDTLITRMTSDVNQVQNGLNLALRLLLRSPFIVFGAMIMAFGVDVHCALIFAVAIPVLAVVVFGIMILSIPLFAKVQEALDRLTGIARENLTGVRVIRAFCKEEQEIEEFDDCNDMLTRINERVGRLSALMNPATFLIINVATIILIYQGALRVEMDILQQGDVVALYNYMALIVVELVKLASLIITIDRSLACADRIQHVLEGGPGNEVPEATSADENPETNATEPSAPLSSAPMVEFRNVTFSYAGAGEAALEGIDFAAARGQTIGVIGGTGSGKSTLVQLIPCFYEVTSGEVRVAGRDVRDWQREDLIDLVGFVPQKAVLFEGSIRDNLRLGNEGASDEELWEALEVAQADEVVRGKDGMLDARIEQGGRNLSGGQRQRLTIARALAKRPGILIMDDSASALDFATDLALRRSIAQLPGDMTVFIVSQRASSVRTADQILVLDDGRLVGIGTHEELMQDCAVYQEIYYSQYPKEHHADDGSSGANAVVANATDTSNSGTGTTAASAASINAHGEEARA